MKTTLRRYPRIIGHLICESLGYFTPKAAARAVEHYKANKPYSCEWYSHMTDLRIGVGDGREFFNEAGLIETGRLMLKYAIQNRKYHRGQMRDYRRAAQLVALSSSGEYDPIGASWF